MKTINLTIFGPGEMLATTSKSGVVVLWTVDDDGTLIREPAEAVDIEQERKFQKLLPIEELRLPIRCYNILKREGINTVGELKQYYWENGVQGFTTMRNASQKDVDTIIQAIRDAKIV